MSEKSPTFSFIVSVLSASGLGINELLYFRVISPEEIGYIFSAAPAKDFGGDFVSTLPSLEFHLSQASVVNSPCNTPAPPLSVCSPDIIL